MRFLIGRERLGQLDRSRGLRMSGFGLEEGFRHNQRLGQRRTVGQRLKQARRTLDDAMAIDAELTEAAA